MNERLRIAFFADTVHAPVGGGVTSAHHFVERLRSEHDVVVVGADTLEDERAVRVPGFVLPVKAMRDAHFIMARPTREAIERAVRHADVVHLQFPFWLSFAALAEAKKQGKPVVAAFHVQPENALYNVGIRSPALNRTVYRLWVKHLYSRADEVVCPSPFAERKLKLHGLTVPTSVLTNGVPTDVIAGPGVREADHEGSFLVMMVGRLAAEKRQDVLFEAVRRMRHKDRVRLVIAGMGPREQELRALAHDLPAEIGFLPRERLLALMRSADLLVHASEVELEGIAVLEAMTLGLPSLVAESPESAASDLALSDTFRFPGGDADALAARLDAFAESPLLLHEARLRSLAKARSFDLDESVARLAEIYRRVHLSTNRAHRGAA